MRLLAQGFYFSSLTYQRVPFPGPLVDSRNLVLTQFQYHTDDGSDDLAMYCLKLLLIG